MNYQSSLRVSIQTHSLVFPRVHIKGIYYSPFFRKISYVRYLMTKYIRTIFATYFCNGKDSIITRVFLDKVMFCVVFIASSKRMSSTRVLYVRNGQYIAHVTDIAVVSENHGGCKISPGETLSALNN